jgi:hypothetical protein
VPASELVTRSRAALGIMPAGTMAGAGGAPWTGAGRAGNARLDSESQDAWPGAESGGNALPGENRGGTSRGERAPSLSALPRPVARRTAFPFLGVPLPFSFWCSGSDRDGAGYHRRIYLTKAGF